MWDLVQSETFKAARDQFDPIPRRFAEHFSATAIALIRDPDLFSKPLFVDDPDRRALTTGAMWDGWEVTVVFDLDRRNRVCTLQWVERVWVGSDQEMIDDTN